METLAFVLWAVLWPVSTSLTRYIDKKYGLIHSDIPALLLAIFNNVTWLAGGAMLWLHATK